MRFYNLLLKGLIFVCCVLFFNSLYLLDGHASDSGLKWTKLGKGSILITEGFEYRKDMKLGYKNTIVIESVEKGVFTAKGGASFIPLFNETEESKKAREKAKKTGGMYFENVSDAVGNEWIFPNKNMTFNVYTPDDLVFKFRSLTNNATIEFRNDGVLVTGFEIKRVKSQ
jgi:hypothetical protein